MYPIWRLRLLLTDFHGWTLLLKDIIASSGHISYIPSIDVCLLPWVDYSVQDRLHAGGDISGHHFLECVQVGDREKIRDDSLVFFGFWDQHCSTVPLFAR